MSLNELIPQNIHDKKFKHRRTQSGSEQEIHKFGVINKCQIDSVQRGDQLFTQFPSSNETQAILNLIQQNHDPMMCIIEPIENNLSKQSLCGSSLFNFGKNQQQYNKQPNLINLKDSNLFQIPELNDLGSNSHSQSENLKIQRSQDKFFEGHDKSTSSHKNLETNQRTHNTKHQKVYSLNLPTLKEPVQQQSQVQTLSAQFQQRIKDLTQPDITSFIKKKLNFNDNTPPLKRKYEKDFLNNLNLQLERQAQKLSNNLFQNKSQLGILSDNSHQIRNYDFLKNPQFNSQKSQLNVSNNMKIANDSLIRTPKSNSKIANNFTLSPEISNFQFHDDRPSYFKQRIHSSLLTNSKHFRNFNLSNSEDRLFSAKKRNDFSQLMAGRIKHLETVIMKIKMKNYDIEDLNKQLLMELKSSNKIQQDMIKKHNEMESRVYSLESILKSSFNQRVPSTRMHTSELIGNNYITDNSLDYIEPERRKKNEHFHTDN